MNDFVNGLCCKGKFKSYKFSIFVLYFVYILGTFNKVEIEIGIEMQTSNLRQYNHHAAIMGLKDFLCVPRNQAHSPSRVVVHVP